ncbi:MAG: IS1595 family transposase [Proteobacteria bacterium]|nr:IS1595 family transposase [Pseudomonadota bacterium]
MKYTINQFRTEFPDDDACLDKVMEMRFGKSFECPKCHRDSKFHRISGRRQYACQFCGHQIAPCAGTVFAKSRTPLSDWFYAMYLFTTSRHGVPAKELERQLGVTYKTAWRMAHQLRILMMVADDSTPLGGHVEIDETLVGGKTTRRKAKAYTDKLRGNKSYVFGMLEREGNVRAGTVVDTKKRTIAPIIKHHVLQGATISTDEHGSYRHLTKAGYEHGVVKHAAHQYTNGIYSTNSIEGFWGRLKTSIRGTHVHVSQKHLNKYVAEFSFRYNNRNAPALMFNHLLEGLIRPRLTSE